MTDRMIEAIAPAFKTRALKAVRICLVLSAFFAPVIRPLVAHGAGDLTLAIQPDNTVTKQTGTQSRTIVLQNPSGFSIEHYSLILSVDDTVVTLTSLDTSASPLPFSLINGGAFKATTGTVVLNKSVSPNGSGAVAAPSFTLGTISYTVNPAAPPTTDPLFLLISASAVGRLGTGTSRSLTIEGRPNLGPPLTPSAANTSKTVSVPITPTPVPTVQTCNRCGYCRGGGVPSSYQTCVQCLFDDPGNLTDPSEQPPAKPKEGYAWTVLGCIKTDAGNLTQQILRTIFGVSGGIAFLTFLTGAFTILTAQGSSERLKNGKHLLTSSLIGLLLIIFSVFLLRAIGVNILQIPGFS